MYVQFTPKITKLNKVICEQRAFYIDRTSWIPLDVKITYNKIYLCLYVKNYNYQTVPKQ